MENFETDVIKKKWYNAEQGYIREEKQINICISKHTKFNVETTNTISITVVIWRKKFYKYMYTEIAFSKYHSIIYKKEKPHFYKWFTLRYLYFYI